MNVFAQAWHVSDDSILGVVMGLLPLFLMLSFCGWVFRLIRTLRDRLDSIEDKLELLLLHHDLTKKQGGEQQRTGFSAEEDKYGGAKS